MRDADMENVAVEDDPHRKVVGDEHEHDDLIEQHDLIEHDDMTAYRD